jgi:hypothetical protein
MVSYLPSWLLYDGFALETDGKTDLGYWNSSLEGKEIRCCFGDVGSGELEGARFLEKINLGWEIWVKVKHIRNKHGQAELHSCEYSLSDRCKSSIECFITSNSPSTRVILSPSIKISPPQSSDSEVSARRARWSAADIRQAFSPSFFIRRSFFRLSNRSDDPAPLAQETIIEGRLLFNRSEHPHLPVVEVTRTDPTLDQAGEFDFLTILHDYIRRYTERD